MDACFSRRSLLAAGGAGLGALTLGACVGIPVPEVDGVGPGGRIAALTDVPVGGAYQLAVDGKRVLIAQPVAGTVVAYDATCPHQGCTVRAGEDGALVCPCHGSAFDLATGDVLQGPAVEPLTPLAVTVSGTDVLLA
jgi:Rieske Fe-S protein